MPYLHNFYSSIFVVRLFCVLSFFAVSRRNTMKFYFLFFPVEEERKISALINNHPIYIFFLFKTVSCFSIFSPFFLKTVSRTQLRRFISSELFLRSTVEGCVNPLRFSFVSIPQPMCCASLLNFIKEKSQPVLCASIESGGWLS